LQSAWAEAGADGSSSDKTEAPTNPASPMIFCHCDQTQPFLPF
jgi:hypothetical protein